MPARQRRPARIVLDYPWPFPVMIVDGKELQVVIKKRRPKPLRKVPPPREWKQQTLL